MDCHILTVVKGLKYCSVLTDKAEEKVSDSDSASTTSEGVEASAGKPKKNRCLACNKKVGLTGKLYLIVYAEQIQSLDFRFLQLELFLVITFEHLKILNLAGYKQC